MTSDVHLTQAEASTSIPRLQDKPQLISAASPRPSTGKSRLPSFYRDIRLCPDGSCALALADDRSLSLYILPTALDSGASDQPWNPEWTYHPPDSILSFKWFPGATPSNPPFFAFALGIKDHPVHLLDGFDHRLRASYPIIDHQERFIAPHSMAFSNEGERLYCGFENAIEVIEIAKPGCAGHRIATSPTRASKSGQKGIISSLAFRPDNSGLLAAGSFSGTIGLYDTHANFTLLKLLKVSDGGGVTKVSFHPAGHLLYAASRLSNSIEVWDMRHLTRSRGRYERAAKTNQRLGFDVDESGTWLVAGDQHGKLQCYSAEIDPEGTRPIASFNQSDFAISNVVFVPGSNWILTTSGSRQFNRAAVSDSASESSSDEHENLADPAEAPISSLQLWQLT